MRSEFLKTRWAAVLVPVAAVVLVVGTVVAAYLVGQRIGSVAPPTPTASPTRPFPVLSTATPTPRPTRTGTPPPTSTPTNTPTPTATPTPTLTPTPTPRVIITEVRALGRLETTKYMLETVIDLERETTNVWEQIFGTDKLLLVASGEVVAGFDLTRVSRDDITVQGDNVLIVLPPPEILYSRVDNSRTYVYERTTGLFRKPDPELEGEARQLAEHAMVERALEGEILEQAKVDGQRQLEAFLRSLGFSEIVLITAGS